MEMNISYILRLGLECNQNCLFCNITPKSEPSIRRLSTDEAKRIIHEKQSTGQANVIVFSGGEPLVRKDLEELIAYAKETGIKTTCLQTNAMGLVAERAHRLKEAGLDTAFIPLHSYSRENFEKITNVPGSFDACIMGIKHLLDNDVLVGINIVICSINYRDLEQTVRFIHDEFGDRIQRMSFSTVQPRGNAANNDDVVPDYHLLTEHMEKGVGAAIECGIEVDNPQCGVPLCIWPEKYRELSMELIHNKSARTRSLSTLWFMDRHGWGSDKVKLPVCSECSVKNLCCGVWKDFNEMQEKICGVKPRFYSYKCWE